MVFSSCASIPKETVQLSNVLGNDLMTLHQSHRNMVDLYYNEIIEDIDEFINEVYTPFIIHYVLKAELKKHQQGNSSLYGTLEEAGKVGGKTETEAALQITTEFLEDANRQIQKKRKELLDPIQTQRQELMQRIDSAYENAFYANATITAYLRSVRKVKESQKAALKLIGMEGKDEEFDQLLLKTSETVKSSLEKAKEIDVESDKAKPKLDEIMKKIKSIKN